jgi:hypothetical protein
LSLAGCIPFFEIIATHFGIWRFFQYPTLLM